MDARLGAAITDVDLAHREDDDWRRIHAAFNEYGVLIFPGQYLLSEAQTDFAARFGRIEQLAPGPDAIPITDRKRGGAARDA